MSRFLCKTILFVGRSSLIPLAKTTGNVNACALRLRWFSVGSECKEQERQSFSVSYLMNSLGFTQKAALSVSKHIKFDGPEKPDKAVNFLRNFGFTQHQIPRLVRSFPQILIMDTEKTILPKLEFLLGKGVSRPELVNWLSMFPNVLKYSLANNIMPSYEYLRAFYGSDEKIAEAVTRYPDILAHKVEKLIDPNFATLREHGVPDSNIASLIRYWPTVFLRTSVQFRETVEEVVRMGFNTSKTTFLVAVAAVSQKTKWVNKVNVYKKMGWSDGEISEAFRRCPWCMCTSEEKIVMVMDFFTAEMGFQPRDLAKFSEVFSLSLEKRVIPRASFYRALFSKGLVKKEVLMSSLLVAPEKKFLEKFVGPYVKESPEVLKLYEEIFGRSYRPESRKEVSECHFED